MWWCQPCNHSNAADAQYCSHCEKHWTQVWAGKRRSRSKKGKEAQPKEKKQDKPSKPSVAAEPEESNPWKVFPESVPWIPTTPHARLVTQEPDPTAGEALGMPPAPVLPSPPVANPAVNPDSGQQSGLTQADANVLSHLKGLIQAGMHLPEAMLMEVQRLQNKEKEGVANKSLTHGHLHRLNRLRGQVQTAAQKVVELDREWESFVAKVTDRIQKHGEMYQTCRADRLETYNRKVQELAAAKQMVSEASQLLVGTLPQPEEAPQPPVVAEMLAPVQEMLSQASQVDPVGTVDLTGHYEGEAAFMDADDVNDVEANEELLVEKPTTYRRINVSPFRAPTSPGKVATHILKTTDTKARKEKRDKA